MKRSLLFILLFTGVALSQNIPVNGQNDWALNEGVVHGGTSREYINSENIDLWVTCTDTLPCLSEPPFATDPMGDHFMVFVLAKSPYFYNDAQYSEWRLQFQGMTWGEEDVVIPWSFGPGFNILGAFRMIGTVPPHCGYPYCSIANP